MFSKLSSVLLKSNLTKRSSLIPNQCFHSNQIIRLVSLQLNSSRKFQTLSKKYLNCVLNSENSVECRRVLSTNSNNSLKSKTLLKSESQIKLAQIISKSPIDSFPLLKDKNFDKKHFQKDNKKLFKALKDCEQNNLNNSLYYPSVSTILNSTLSVQSLVALDKWKKLKISQLGEQGFKDYQKNILLRGSLFHKNIKNFIKSRDESTLEINESIEKLWKSLSHVFEDIGDVQLCETPISHPFLCYKGILDCVAHYSGKLVLVEWKTSEKLKPSLKDIYDNPLQAVAYLGAINYETQHCFPIEEIVLVYAYEDGTNAQIHHLSVDQCNQYWKQWLSRVKSYWDLLAFKQTIS